MAGENNSLVWRDKLNLVFSIDVISFMRRTSIFNWNQQLNATIYKHLQNGMLAKAQDIYFGVRLFSFASLQSADMAIIYTLDHLATCSFCFFVVVFFAADQLMETHEKYFFQGFKR